MAAHDCRVGKRSQYSPVAQADDSPCRRAQISQNLGAHNASENPSAFGNGEEQAEQATGPAKCPHQRAGPQNYNRREFGV